MRAAVGGLVLVLVGCGGASIPEVELDIRVEVDVVDGSVDAGKGFPLRVVRTFAEVLDVEALKVRQLLPVRVRPMGVRTERDGGYVREVHEFLAHVFEVGEFVVPAVTQEARRRGGGGADVVIVESEKIALTVRPALSAEHEADTLEPFGTLLPLPEERRVWPWVLLFCAGALMGLLVVRGRRRQREVVAPTPAPAPVVVDRGSPSLRAMGRIAGLRARQVESVEDSQLFFEELAALVRDYLHERFALVTSETTTRELLTARETKAVLSAEQMRTLRGVLGQCDLVKFAKDHPDLQARIGVLGMVEGLVGG